MRQSCTEMYRPIDISASYRHLFFLLQQFIVFRVG